MPFTRFDKANETGHFSRMFVSEMDMDSRWNR
jgi:hypothetical protein